MSDHDELCARCGRPLADQHFNEALELLPTRRVRYCDECFRHYGMTPGKRVHKRGLAIAITASGSLFFTWLLTGEQIFLWTILAGTAVGGVLWFYVRAKLGS